MSDFPFSAILITAGVLLLNYYAQKNIRNFSLTILCVSLSFLFGLSYITDPLDIFFAGWIASSVLFIAAIIYESYGRIISLLTEIARRSF